MDGECEKERTDRSVPNNMNCWVEIFICICTQYCKCSSVCCSYNVYNEQNDVYIILRNEAHFSLAFSHTDRQRDTHKHTHTHLGMLDRFGPNTNHKAVSLVIFSSGELIIYHLETIFSFSRLLLLLLHFPSFSQPAESCVEWWFLLLSFVIQKHCFFLDLIHVVLQQIRFVELALGIWLRILYSALANGCHHTKFPNECINRYGKHNKCFSMCHAWIIYVSFNSHTLLFLSLSLSLFGAHILSLSLHFLALPTNGSRHIERRKPEISFISLL